MRLTRRDALAALAAAGATAGGAALLAADAGDPEGGGSGDRSQPLGEAEFATLVGAAEVLYPSKLEGVETFVTRYLRGRAEDRPDHARGIAGAASYLEEYAQAWYEEEFRELEPATRGEVLRRMGADTADPDPAGSDVERVRYYVVNELLFALYTTPTGGELVGLENPQGHPGGVASYQRRRPS